MADLQNEVLDQVQLEVVPRCALVMHHGDREAALVKGVDYSEWVAGKHDDFVERAVLGDDLPVFNEAVVLLQLDELPLVDDELEVHLNRGRLLLAVELRVRPAHFLELLDVLPDRLVQDVFDVVDDVLDNFVVHLRKHNHLKEWLDGSENLKGIWPDLEDKDLLIDFGFDFPDLLLTLPLQLLPVPLADGLPNYDVLLVEVLLFFQMLQVFLIVDIDLANQRVFNVDDQRFMVFVEVFLLNLVPELLVIRHRSLQFLEVYGLGNSEPLLVHHLAAHDEDPLHFLEVGGVVHLETRHLVNLPRAFAEGVV